MDCIICTEKLGDEKPLECGHFMHLDCVKKHFKPECPLCRRVLNIKVTGTLPIPFVPSDETDGVSFIWRRVVITPFINPVDDHVYETGFEDETSGCEDEAESLPDEDDSESLPDLEVVGGIRNKWKRKGYAHREEDDDYDEENPLGDEWEYEDV